MTVILRPSHLPVVGNVAPQQIASLRAPGWAFGPQHTGVKALDRRVGLGEVVEGRVDRDNVGVPEIGGRGAARTEIARRAGDRRRRRHGAALGQRAACSRYGGAGAGGQAVDKRSSRYRGFWIALLWIVPLLACHRILPMCSPAVDRAWQ